MLYVSELRFLAREFTDSVNIMNGGFLNEFYG